MGKMLMLLVFVVAVYFGMKFINQVKTFGTIGVSPKEAMTIDSAGEGDSYAIPDVSTISYAVEAKGKTAQIAQNLVIDRINKSLSFLEGSSIDKKDIQTVNYSTYPEYSTPCVEGNKKPCPKQPATPEIIDYDVNQSVTVKIRDTNIVGKIVEGLTAVGVSGIVGPNFSVDNPDAVKALAKQKAIDDAKQKAVVLAGQLGLHLGKIIRFNDQSNPTPVMYSAKANMAGLGGDAPEAADSNSMPAGQSKYVSNVIITYEVY